MSAADRLSLATDKPIDVVALGNAIVDILAFVDDDFLDRHHVTKGAMTLIDHGVADTIHRGMTDPREISGGSAANTIVGLASLGARAAFAGKVKDDHLGGVFGADIRRMGVTFDTAPFPADHAGSTARSMILVSPDAQRSMLTDLGVSTDFSPEDIPLTALDTAKVVYLEGYLWDKPASKRAFSEAMDRAKAAGGKVALTLSDTFCVDRHRESFLEILNGPVDILFANDAELKALYETESFEEAVDTMAETVTLGVVTRSELGCVVFGEGARVKVPADPVQELVDTTGAGDLFASGFLYGVVTGRDLETCGRMGCASAAEVIQHLGARPEHNLKALFQARGLI